MARMEQDIRKINVTRKYVWYVNFHCSDSELQLKVQILYIHSSSIQYIKKRFTYIVHMTIYIVICKWCKLKIAEMQRTGMMTYSNLL